MISRLNQLLATGCDNAEIGNLDARKRLGRTKIVKLMEKFKELSLEEKTYLDGGSILTGIGIFGSLNSASIAASEALRDFGDLVSGLGDGFIQGFKQTNQKW